MSFALAIPEKEIGGSKDLFNRPDAGVLSDLLDSYAKQLAELESVYKTLQIPQVSSVINLWFREKDYNYNRLPKRNTLEEMKLALSSDFWQKALDATDVYQHMPNDSRSEWQDNIRNWKVPHFERDVVARTIMELLISRDMFLAKRVDGIFRSLSGDHVTNSPSGFGKRMILNYAIDAYGSANYNTAGYIDDVRIIIAKFMKRDYGGLMNSKYIVQKCFDGNPGKWVEVDGGALKIRVYKKGTAHLEIHPDIAWRLNDILAILYPMAIPPEFRKKSKDKAVKEFDLTQQLIDLDTLYLIENLELVKVYDRTGHQPRFTGYKKNCYRVRYGIHKPIKELDRVLALCGGIKQGEEYQFDYDFINGVRNELVALGRVPDHVSHQFFPTQEVLSIFVNDLAEIEDDHDCLEPSAGQGGIAIRMPLNSTLVEINPLNVAILKAKGFENVIADDFLKWAQTAPKFDRICMNPPFSNNRAKLHVEAAMELLKPNGICVAVLPPTLKGKIEKVGYEFNWSESLHDQFAATKVTVKVVQIKRL